MLEPEKSASISMAKRRSLTSGPGRSNAPIRIKYGPNPQGIKEVEIQRQLVDILFKNSKENKKKPELKRTTQLQKRKHPRLSPHLLKRIQLYGNKRKKLQSPPPHHYKQTKWCENQRKCNHPCPLLRAWMYHLRARNEGRRVLLIGL